MLKCPSMHELDKVFTDLVTILVTKSATTASAAMSRLNVFQKETSIDYEEDDENECDDLIAYPDEMKYKTIFEGSCFFLYFKRIKAKVIKLLHENEKKMTTHKNEY